ncbi:MAG: hypothetical protein QOE63_1029, partial [Acidimicrobiaceae bacterium]
MIASLAIRFDVVAIGAMSGLGYALLAAGLVLVYRSTRIINLAHGQIGTLSAFLVLELSHNAGFPYPLAVVAAVASGGLLGVVIERGLVRPLLDRSRLAVLVATVGVTQLLLVAQSLLPEVLNARYPVAVHWDAKLGNLLLHGEHFTLLLAGPLLLVAFAAYLARSRYGLAIRAIADNREAGQLAGISAERVSTLVWLLAGVMAAVAAILTTPLGNGGVNAGVGLGLGPSLLLRALAAGLVGRLTNLPRTILAGIGIGIVEAVLFASYPADLGLVDVVLFALVLELLLLQSRGATGAAESLSFGEDLRPLPERIARHPRVRRMRQVGIVVAAAVALRLPLVYSSSANLFLLSRIPVFAIIGISIVILTGWAGQLSLGQMAFVGFGALGTSALASRGVPFGAAVVYATIGGLVLSIVVGAPALRLRGLFLTVTTLGLAVASSSYLLHLDLFTSAGVDVAVVSPGKLGPLDFDSYRVDYYGCLAALVAMIAIARRLRRSGIGRVLIAVEGNEASAAAMTVSPAVAKLTAFAIAGAMATFAGGLLAGITRTFQVDLFSPDQSLQVLAMVVVGGVGSVLGAVLGAIYLIGVPTLLGDSTTTQLATSGIGLLVVLRAWPGGLVQIINRVRDRMYAGLAIDAEPAAAAALSPTIANGHGNGVRPSKTVPTLRTAPTARADDGDRTETAPLRVQGLTVVLGGRTIVDQVELHVGPDEIVALIGSNGAGKTTLMNAISGFVGARGSMTLHGEELGSLSPAERARRGLGRSFQQARLFPRLTVRECVQVALESQRRSEIVPSLLALPPAIRDEHWSRRAADEILEQLHLGERAEQPTAALSTGTRRIVELACLLALRPRVVLLDEPMAGIAQRESEAFGPLLLDVRRELGSAM